MQSSSAALLPRARGLITASPAKRQCVTTATLAPVRQKPAAPPRHAASSVSISTPLAQRPTLPQQQPQPVAAPAPSGRVVLEDPEELKSTWVHRAWVGGTSLLLAGVLANGLAGVHDAGSAATAAAAALAAYLTADFGSAVYHWGVDNYGSGETPLVGGQIAAFQGHHQRPWTITEREFCNNVHKVFQPAAPFAAALLAAAPSAPIWWNVWSSSFIMLVCMSQQFHAWSHMKPSELPAAVVALQDSGLLISRKDHGAHHRAPFTAKYSIVSGLVNPWMDRDCPENSVWRQWELFIHERTGVEPRCWHEPDYSWTEQERPSA